VSLATFLIMADKVICLHDIGAVISIPFLKRSIILIYWVCWVYWWFTYRYQCRVCK